MKNVTIVGVGALGSHVVLMTRSCKINVRAIDFDRVEMKNISSQFHGKPGVGKLKVNALDQAMNMFFAYRITCISSKLSLDNQDSILKGSDLVVDCLDNGDSRRIVQNYVRTAKIPCVHGALAADGGFGRVVWDERFVIDDAAPGAPTCEAGEHLPFIGIVSSYLSRSIQEFVTSGNKIGWEVSPGGAMQTLNGDSRYYRHLKLVETAENSKTEDVERDRREEESLECRVKKNFGERGRSAVRFTT